MERHNSERPLFVSGTGISIYGGHRPNYGAFTISVDGQTIASGDASSPTATAQQLLGSASGLTNGPHTAVLTNSGGSAIDIDFVDVQSQVGPPKFVLRHDSRLQLSHIDGQLANVGHHL